MRYFYEMIEKSPSAGGSASRPACFRRLGASFAKKSPQKKFPPLLDFFCERSCLQHYLLHSTKKIKIQGVSQFF